MFLLYFRWSAYGYSRHLTGDNKEDADAMELIDQEAAYNQVGMKIKEDLLGGNAVVLFAYGLSGSGKVRVCSVCMHECIYPLHDILTSFRDR